MGSPISKLDHAVFGLPIGFVLPLSQQIVDDLAVNSNKIESTVERPGMAFVIPLSSLTNIYALKEAIQIMADAGSHSEDKGTLSTVTTTETLPVLPAPILTGKKPQ